MPFQLPKIYPLTDALLTRLSHLEQVESLIDGGAHMIQLREKTLSPKQFYVEAKKAIDYARPRGVKIIINDRVDIAFVTGADGVHLGQDDLPPAAARQILGDKAIIGFSTHSTLQAVAALKLPLDYVAVGPIFTTASKENPDPVVGLDGLKKVREAIGDFPLVAIGGINFENALQVLKNGADSLAVIGAILKPSAEIATNFKKLDRISR